MAAGAGNWIKLHRSLLESDIWGDPSLVTLWIWCLLRANHRDREFQGRIIRRGSFVTGRHQAAQELGYSGGKVLRGLDRLESRGMITRQANNRFTIVTICKYESYQGTEIDDGTANGTADGTANGTADGTADGTANGTRTRRIRIKEGEEGKNNTPLTPPGGTADQNPPRTPKRRAKASYAVEDQAYPRPLDTDAFRAAWQTWTLHRIEIGKPMTPLAAAKTLAKCESLGPARAIAAIDHSIANGWQGLFEPQATNGNGSGKGPLGYDPDPRGTFAAARAWMDSKKQQAEDAADGHN